MALVCNHGREGVGKQRDDQAQPRTPCEVRVEGGPDRVDGMGVIMEESAQDGLPLGVIDDHRCLGPLGSFRALRPRQKADGAGYAGMECGVLQEKRGEKGRPRLRR
jgi:hypothetical protein